MFYPVSGNVFRWGTPDPTYDWMMYGYLILGDDGITLIDPPLIPDFLENVKLLGTLKSIVLTTLDHSRGSAYIVEKTGATLYVPDQSVDDIDPVNFKLKDEVKEHVVYKEGNISRLTAFRLKTRGDRSVGVPSMNEFALLTENGELMVGDFASVSMSGKIKVVPEWYPSIPQAKPFPEGIRKFRETVKRSGAKSLLTSHGGIVKGNLQEVIEDI